MKSKIRLLVIDGNSTIKECLQKLQLNEKRFLVCINDSKEILGLVTDGDLRRGLLNNYTLLDPVRTIYKTNYKYLTIHSSFDQVCELFKSNRIEFLPVVDDKMKLKNIITKKQFHVMLLEDVGFDLSLDFSKFDDAKLEHEIFNKPWGFYKSTILSSHAQAKMITVFPMSELSLQEHKKREEHWVIIKGEGKVVLGESLLDAYPGKYFYIPIGCKHQILNNSDENLIFSEVQLGAYFGEDDIIRYQDKYGRVNKT